LEGAFDEGIGFDGSSIEGLARVSEADLIAQPDPSTFQILPWRGGHHGTARMFCNILNPDGQPAAADPRNVLKRAPPKAPAPGPRWPPRATSAAGPAGGPTPSAAPPSPCWTRWASRWRSPTTRPDRARTRSTCATRTP